MLRILLVCVLCLASAVAVAQERLIVVAPSGDPRHAIGTAASSVLDASTAERFGIDPAQPLLAATLAEALGRARPGTLIWLLDGVYDQANEQDRLDIQVSGSDGDPVVISGPARGASAGATIDGSGLRPFEEPPEWIDPNHPLFQGFVLPPLRASASCILLSGRSHVVIENVTMRGCRDAALYAEESHHITLRDATVEDGQYVVLATGRTSHHFLVEGVTWLQDPSGAMWQRDHWCEFKYGERRHLNGALFASQDILGGVIVRRNKVRFAFNAVRMDVSDEADPAMRGKVNTNVEIYENEFHNICDNVVEPEFDATNWWIHDNVIHNAHAWFSFDGLHGGRYYVHHNTGYFDDRPSRLCDVRCRDWKRRDPEECGDLHDGGRVLKFRKPKHTPPGQGLPGPVYVFNNSWYLRASVTKDGMVREFSHWNNAIEYCRRGDPIDGACSPTDANKPFFKDFLPWPPRFDFRFDLSNHRDFPANLRAAGYGVDGISVAWPQRVFARPWAGDFTLLMPELAEAAGCLVHVGASGAASCDENGPVRPDIGALQDGVPRAAFYVHLERGLYDEAPRIVHVDWPAIAEADGSARIRIHFSVPVTMPGARSIELSWTDGGTARSDPCRLDGRALSCRFPAGAILTADEPRKLMLPAGLSGPTGLAPTLWGRYTDFVTLPPSS